MAEININITNQTRRLITNGSRFGVVNITSLTACNIGATAGEISVFIRRKSDSEDSYFLKGVQCEVDANVVAEDINIPSGYYLYIYCALSTFSINIRYR